MNAMVLCAGLGTRLRPLTEQWPKPALPLLGQPLLRTTLAVLQRAGARAVGINTHHLPDVMARVAESECARAGLALSVVHEPVIQGTGGGIRGLAPLLRQSDVSVVFNGDILFPVDLAPLIAEHRAKGAAATMLLLPMPPGEKYASVDCDAEGRVRRIAGHGPGGEALTPWHFTGVHLLSPAVFDFMSESGPEDINRDVYPRMIAQGLTVRGARAEAYWSDLGTPARYLSTVGDLLSGRVPLDALGKDSPLAGAPEQAPGVRVRNGGRILGSATGPVLVDQGGQVEVGGQVGPRTYVGVEARVEAGANVTDSVVLEGVTVKQGERLERAIAWKGGRIYAAT